MIKLLKSVKHRKKVLLIMGFVALLILFAIYMYAMLLPGFRHEKAFLYKQPDNSFKGSDIYAQYEMKIQKNGTDRIIDFSVNGNKNTYKIINTVPQIKILKNSEEVFSGKAFETDNGYILIDINNNIDNIVKVRVSNQKPPVDELFPSFSWLYSVAFSEKTEHRGNFLMLFGIILAGLILFLDIKFPRMFFWLEHGLDVDGGEPSDWYLFGQQIGRTVLVIFIIVSIVLSFTSH